METSGTPPVRAGMVLDADGVWQPLTTSAKSNTITTYGTPQMVGIMAQNSDGTWSGWTGGSGATTPPEQVYPPAGVAVSDGTAWGTSIPAAEVALLNAANTFAVDQTFGGAVVGEQGISVTGLVPQATDVLNLSAGGGIAYIDSCGLDASTRGAISFRLFSSTGGFGVTPLILDSAGNATFSGTVTSGAVNITEMITSLQARIAALEAKVGNS